MSFLDAHAKDYKDAAWKEYSVQELGNFIHLLVKRASMRDNAEKRSKDLYDAHNYLTMIEMHLQSAEASF
jgi:hypothetical protein